MPVEMETISLIAEAKVNVITLHTDLKEPFSSGSLMNNLAFDASQLPFSQEGACVEKHVENHSFKNDFRKLNLCIVWISHILILIFLKVQCSFELVLFSVCFKISSAFCTQESPK